MKTLFLALCAALAAPKCIPSPEPVPPMPSLPEATPDAPVVFVNRDCETAFQHLAAVDCIPVTGQVWADACAQERSVGMFDLSCVRKADTRKAAEACGITCR